MIKDGVIPHAFVTDLARSHMDRRRLPWNAAHVRQHMTGAGYLAPPGTLSKIGTTIVESHAQAQHIARITKPYQPFVKYLYRRYFTQIAERIVERALLR